MTLLNYIFTFIYITFTLSRCELLCLTELDPICLVEMDNFKQGIPDFETGAEFIAGLLEFTLGPDSSDARNAMIPHILSGLTFQPNIDCAGGEIFDAIINSKDGDNGLNGDEKIDITISDQYLDENDIKNWMNEDYILSQTSKNKHYTNDVISTLKNIAETDIKPLFAAVGFDENLAFVVTFSLTSCIDVEITPTIELSGCASFGYGFVINGKDELKYFVTGGYGTSSSLGIEFDIPFGFDYSISYDFFGDIEYVAGIGSSVEVGVDFSVAPSLNLLAGLLGDVMIPEGVSFQIGYNGPILLIDCYSWGFSIKGFSASVGDSGGAQISFGVSLALTSWISDGIVSEECNTDLIDFGFSESQLGDACMIHEHCAGYGLGLTAAACCAGECKKKQGGSCPKAEIGEACCFGLDCAGYGISGDVACCNGNCGYTETDYLGIKWCPRECKAGATCAHGTCGIQETKSENEECSCHEECKGYGIEHDDMACCFGKCKQKEYGFCPPRELGESCMVHTDCRNWGPDANDVACCDGICTTKIQDFTGVGYCPGECRAGPLCDAGSCESEETKSENEQCSCHEECQGYGTGLNDMACCYGKCEEKKFGWCDYRELGESCGAHTDCRNWGPGLEAVACCFGICEEKSNGFCPLRELGESCMVHTDCRNWGPDANDVACCDGICSTKISNWAGVGYCPSECQVGISCGGGTCGTEETKNENQKCSCHEQCKGYGLGLNDMACCAGICEEKKFGFCEYRELGESCSLHTDCRNWGPGSTDVACCKGICTKKVEDYEGWGYCPHECKEGLGCPAGSCVSSKRKEDESCSCHEQCSGYGLLKTDMACCDGTCQQKVVDYLGLGWCPSECKAGLLCDNGSCDDNFGEGKSCSCNEQCSGSRKCCAGKCTSLIKDWANVYYCPHECRDGLTCPTGSCGDSKGEWGYCSCNEQCGGGRKCCGGRCRTLLSDWAGVKYCPHECKGGAGCSAGTCPRGRSSGTSCSCAGSCSSGCCEGGKCVSKKKDYVGTWWCPKECKKCLWCSHGSC